MLNLPVYLYTPAIRVFIDLDNNTKLGVDHMYHGYATLAKGIKNTLRFNFVNGEQRAINVNDSTFKFRLFDYATNKQVLEKNLVVTDNTVIKTISTAQTVVGKTITLNNVTNISVGQTVYGLGVPKNTTVDAVVGTTITLSNSTTKIAPIGTSISIVTYALKGSAELRLVSNDTANLNAGRYTYAITRLDSDNELSPVFVNGASDMIGNIELTDGILPRFIDSETLTFNRVVGYYGAPDSWSTGHHAANKDGRGNNSLHTAQLYFTNFTGNVKVFASLDNTAVTPTWSEVESFDYTNQTNPTYINLSGYDNVNYFKFEYIPSSGSIDKVLYRS
jgi:hypothetical protein